MPERRKSFRTLFIIYWIFLAYTIAALVWWYIELNMQNKQMTNFRLVEALQHKENYNERVAQIRLLEKRKKAQYLGEGAAFIVLIAAGAIYVYRTFRNSFKESVRQQNFMMAITHELKTPIAVTKLNLETLQKRNLDEAQRNKFIANTLQEANRLDTLCNNLLLSSQLEAGRYNIINEEQDLSQLVENCINNFLQRNSGREIMAKLVDNIYVHGDKLLLEIVVNNLVENALKYSPKDKPISVSLQAEGGTAILSVADWGPGIFGKDKEKVFYKHYRIGNDATQKAKGTGLGLYLVKNILTKLGGKISINENQPMGSIFVVSLPANI